jgi:hypothetical protein
MKELLERCNPRLSSLAGELRILFSEGLVHNQGCVLLKSQVRLTQPYDSERFLDETGYECFVNHVHLGDILASTDACDLRGQALVLADELAILKSAAAIVEELDYIVACGPDEVSIRFHAIRTGPSWLADDLETYAEAVAAIRLCAGSA